MADLIQAANLTAQMLRMRDAMRSIWGERYPEKVAPWQSAIAKVADGKHLDPLQAAIELVKAADGNGFAVIAVMAAYVETIEPSTDHEPRGVAA